MLWFYLKCFAYCWNVLWFLTLWDALNEYRAKTFYSYFLINLLVLQSNIKRCSCTLVLQQASKFAKVICPFAPTLVLGVWHGIVSLGTKITCEIPAGCLHSAHSLFDSWGTASDAQQRNKVFLHAEKQQQVIITDQATCCICYCISTVKKIKKD